MPGAGMPASGYGETGYGRGAPARDGGALPYGSAGVENGAGQSEQKYFETSAKFATLSSTKELKANLIIAP